MLKTSRLGMFTRVARPQQANVHFLTDTEGHFSFLRRSVDRSRVVSFDSARRLQFRTDIDNPYFVFGGDLTDRGVGDTDLAELLLDFKCRNPERVILLVGNREASKTRFHVELNPKHIRQRLLHGSVPFWLLSGPHQFPIEYVKKHVLIKTSEQPDTMDLADYVESLSVQECQLIYLKWMLEQNLGCPHTFDYHAQQLASLRGCDRSQINDYMVLSSIMEQNAPNGLMGQYLAQTQMAAIIPGTGIMAVHGGLTPENIGRVPSMKRDAPKMDNVHDWIDAINCWYAQAVQEWLSIDQNELPLELHPARTKLDTFSERIPGDFRSIVTASMLGPQREFQPVPSVVSEYLKQSGISMVLTGHQPIGDHPAILRSSDDSVVFVNGDVSYANVAANNVHDTRGDVWHNIHIDASIEETQLNIEAQLLSGSLLTHQLKHSNGRVIDDTPIGKVLPEGELVLCRLPETSHYRTIHQQGYRVTYKIREELEIKELIESSNNKATLC